jgi:uncharacterized protein YqjF (DUF2071 family)
LVQRTAIASALCDVLLKEGSRMIRAAASRLRVEPMPTTPLARPFLTAAWRDFLMLSYEIEPAVLRPFVPRGTELDDWHGRSFVSLVGFRFCDARLFGIRVPGHQEFAEVNLRFYVRRRVDDQWRRGVVFLRELAAKRCVAIVAHWFYGERFRRVPMACTVDRDKREGDFANEGVALPAPRNIAYAWRDRGRDYRLAGKSYGVAHLPEPDSLAEFIVDHYWAYTATPRGAAYEYLVPHSPWRISDAEGRFTGDAYRQYGPRFAPYLRGAPASAFWATGSNVRVFRGTRL